MQPGGAEILLTNSLSPGGLCEHAENHLAYFMAPSYLIEQLDKKVKVHCLNYKGTTDVVRLIREIRRIIIENDIDIVHSHLNPAGLYTHLACPKKVPHVHTIHTTYSMDEETTKFKLWTERFFYLNKKNVNIILLSDFIRNDFLKNVSFKGKSFVLNNFIPDDFFDIHINTQLSTLKEVKLIAIGSLRPLKNFDYLLEVFKFLKNYNITLDIYGGGNTAPYELKIKEYGIRVKMMGHAKNLKDTIGNYDGFIMPSKFEGFPLSVFESMAAGLPLILSDIAPLKSIVKDNAVYFSLDNAEVLAGQLINIFKNKTDVNAMALKGKIYAEKTARRSIYITKLLDIYNQIVY